VVAYLTLGGHVSRHRSTIALCIAVTLLVVSVVVEPPAVRIVLLVLASGILAAAIVLRLRAGGQEPGTSSPER
jgi:hypothetical protein